MGVSNQKKNGGFYGTQYSALISVVAGEVDEVDVYTSGSPLADIVVTGSGNVLTFSKFNAFTLSPITGYPKVTFNVKRLSDNNDENSADIWIQDMSGDESEFVIVKYDGDPIAGFYIIELTAY